MQPSALKSFLNNDPQIRFSREDGRDGDKVTLGGIRDHLDEGGLAGTGRSPQDDRRKETIRLDGAAQELSLTNDVFLPNILIQGARAHTSRKRSFLLHAF